MQFPLPEEQVMRPPAGPQTMPPGMALAQMGQQGPRMPSPNGLIPASPVTSPRAPLAQPAAPLSQPSAQAQAPKPMSFDDQTKAYRNMMRQQYPDMSPEDFEMYASYGIAKQRGRMAAQRSKELSKPMAKYLSAMGKKDAAELQYQQLGEKLKHRKMEFTMPDGRMDPGFAPYKDQLDAARLKVESRRKSLAQQRQLLNKLGVKDDDLQNPVTMHEFMRSLASAKPETANDFEDDTDLLDNEE